jgi:4-hydroxy-3-methylbut-2-enyl diphosphate reductase
VSVLAQTTVHAETDAEIVDVLRERFDEITVHDSICRATAERQEEARSLAAECDAVVVVGGRHSANTRRLAEVAGADGTPVYHVETADELDLERLAEHPVIGVTAGASTPGWLTQTVLDRLQTLNRRGAGGMLRGLLIGAVRSYLYSAVAAVGLALAAMHLLGLQTLPLGTLALVFAYVFVVYTINRRATQPRGNPAAGGRPPRGRENRLLLAAGGLGLGSLALAWHYGPGVLLLLALAYAAGIIYTVPLLPRRFSRRRLKDIPASKDLFVAAAWAVVLTGLPVLVAGLSPLGEAVLGTGAIVFLLVFGKTVALDLRDTEGDRLIGTETIPVLAGRRAALRLLYALQVLVLGALVALTAATIFPPVGWALALLPLYGLGYLRLFDKGLLAEETRCQAIVDGQFLLAGVLTAAMHLAGLGGGAG